MVGTNECPVGLMPITTAPDCKSMADQLSLVWKGSEETVDFPKGCYVWQTSEVWFNPHSRGRAEPDSAPLCRDSNRPPPGTAPAAVMAMLGAPAHALHSRRPFGESAPAPVVRRPAVWKRTAQAPERRGRVSARVHTSRVR